MVRPIFRATYVETLYTEQYTRQLRPGAVKSTRCIKETY